MAARQGAYQDLRRGSFDQIASAVAVALEHCLAHEELRRLRDRLQAENLYLQEEIQTQHNFSEIVGNSPALLTALGRVERVAATDTTVLILGETGSGKELFARAVHSRSRRADRPLVKVNCGAIAPGLIESELFGHVKGAFTGAIDKRVGRFEVAHGGTILLDEIGEMPLDAQVKLLRVLQEQEFEVVGSSRTVRVDVRVIASTNRNLEHAVRAGTFRADLLYRLNVFPIEVPPLRARTSDIPLLVALFIGALTRKLGKPLQGFTTSAMERLIAYDWPGNVRELSNVVERAAILARGPVLDLEEWPLAAPEARVESSGVLAAGRGSRNRRRGGPQRTQDHRSRAGRKQRSRVGPVRGGSQTSNSTVDARTQDQGPAHRQEPVQVRLKPSPDSPDSSHSRDSQRPTQRTCWFSVLFRTLGMAERLPVGVCCPKGAHGLQNRPTGD